MDVALVEDAEHDVHRHQRAEDHQRLALGRGLERPAGATDQTLHLGGQVDLGHGLGNRLVGLLLGDVLGQRVADAFRGELALVVDPILLQAALPAGEAG
ncbi:hypothetical protein D3C78_1798370 [compost metagenome]